MPITEQFDPLNAGKLALWKIEESVEFLQSSLDLTHEQERALALRATASGKKGFLAVRAALVHLGNPLTSLTVDPMGAPLLPNHHCSFSHTPDFAAVALDQSPVGVDIEFYRPKIKRIMSKFVHAKEVSLLPQQQAVEWLTRLWTAKEALYKILKIPGLSLSQDIEVAPFTLEDTVGTAKVQYGKESHFFELHFRTFENHQLTIAKKRHL